jgi:ABC-2 type transport system permease protein
MSLLSSSGEGWKRKKKMQNLPAVERKASGFRLFLMTIIGRAYPRIVSLQRDFTWLLFDVLLPMGGVIGYVLVYKAIHAPEDYVGFVVMGGAMTAFWLNVLWAMSSQLYWEKEQGNLALYIISPANLMAILLGMAVGGIIFTTLRAVSVILIGSWLFQVHYVLASFWQLIAVFLLCLTALYGMGMMASSTFLLLSREAWHISNLAQEPVSLVSGFYFPIKFFPFWVAAAASMIPLTLGLDAMRQLLFASGPALGFISVPLEILILVGLSAVFITGARLLLKYMEKLAKREGRLTEARR